MGLESKWMQGFKAQAACTAPVICGVVRPNATLGASLSLAAYAFYRLQDFCCMYCSTRNWHRFVHRSIHTTCALFLTTKLDGASAVMPVDGLCCFCMRAGYDCASRNSNATLNCCITDR